MLVRIQSHIPVLTAHGAFGSPLQGVWRGGKQASIFCFRVF